MGQGLELLPAPPTSKEAQRLAGPPLRPGNLAVYFCLWAPCFHRVSPGRLAAAGLEGWSSCSVKGPAATLPPPPARPEQTQVKGDIAMRERGAGGQCSEVIPNTWERPRAPTEIPPEASQSGWPNSPTYSPDVLPGQVSLHPVC